MSWLSLQTVAQFSVERVLNTLPEGLLIALFAWALLRVLRRRNSGTRFAVWFMTLLAVAALPMLGEFGGGRAVMASGMAWGNARPAITMPGRWALFAFLAWAAGAGVAMLRLATGFWRLRGLRRSCTPVVAANLDPMQQTIASFGGSPITIATSESVWVPAAIGFWKRTIVLPAWALRELPPEDLNVILLHEFAHLRRGDDWTNLIQKMVHALFFFHPAVWWIENRLSVEREMACDDAVLAETANPHGYATCLVSLLEKSLSHRRWSMAQAAVHRAREASLRLAQILDKNRPVATRVWKPALGMIGAFSMVCLAVLPHAPQFVGFDQGMAKGDPVYSAAVNLSSVRSSLTTAAIIPAGLRIAGSSFASSLPRKTSRGTTAKVIHAHVYAQEAAGKQLDPARAAARMNLAPSQGRVIAISASENREVMPEFQTLVFIEATQYRTSDSAVWRVQVWRVTLGSPMHERLLRVPVANSL